MFGHRPNCSKWANMVGVEVVGAEIEGAEVFGANVNLGRNGSSRVVKRAKVVGAEMENAEVVGFEGSEIW